MRDGLRALGAAWLLWLAFPCDAQAEPSMAETLAELRVEVNQLDAALRSQRADSASTLRGLAASLSELEAVERAERLKLKSLEAELASLTARTAARESQAVALRQALTTAIAQVERVTKESLPFRKEERLAALTQIAQDNAHPKTNPAELAEHLWRFMEDEQRLAATVELAELPLSLSDGKPPTLVRAVRVGLLALFVLKPSGDFGRVVLSGDGRFAFSDVTDPAQAAELKRLFAATERQIREGRYRLPIFGEGVRLP